ncbi:ATP-grasp fold amidoligase family protein [Kytococcus schroeteri]|uniref:ATP-grasp fold amidoligase family protein n=1 Tax=Kytococcus schroeteri TaxID=138300 RepID=UPI0035E49513
MTSSRLRSLARRLRPGAERRRQLEEQLARCGGQLSQREDELSRAHAELSEVRSELTRVRGRLEQASAMRAVVDAPNAMPRAVLPPAVQDRLRSAGFRNTGGTKKGDPRAYASFVAKLFEVRRYTYAVQQTGLPHPRPVVSDRLSALALAASHGIGVPTIHGLWRAPEEIDLSGLPDTFVLKANRSAGSRGVIPLRRQPGHPDRYEVTDDSSRSLSASEVIDWVTSRPGLRGPWYAEEMLVGDDGSGSIPHDYKVYCFYGEIGGGFVRRTHTHFGVEGFSEGVRFRYFDHEGRDAVWRKERVDQSIPLSPQLPEILETARRLSRVAPLPFLRVDLYATTRGVVMGELTLGPGGNQYLRAEDDVRFGRLWERAQVRLESDLYTGARPYGLVAGDHPVPELLREFLPGA